MKKKIWIYFVNKVYYAQQNGLNPWTVRCKKIKECSDEEFKQFAKLYGGRYTARQFELNDMDAREILDDNDLIVRIIM